MTDWLPPDIAARLMDAAWVAFDWRMALSPHNAMLLATALMGVIAFGIVAILSPVVAD